MLNSHERHLALSYLANMLGRLRRKRAQAASLLEWLTDNVTPLASGARTGERIAVAASNASESPANWRELRRLVDKARRAASDAVPDRMARRLRRLAETVGLSSLDVDILEVLLRYGTQPVVESLIDAAFYRVGGSRMPMNVRGGALSCVLGQSLNAVDDRFAEDAPLVRTGLVSTTRIRMSRRSTVCAAWTLPIRKKSTCGGSCSARAARANSSGRTSNTSGRAGRMCCGSSEARPTAAPAE
ncbi:MAG: hypothetical protein OXL38_21345 [Gammaproteobacteria bacterium]|nr:hypothetical protein [Gammaproteobacteria bacterium]